MTDGFEADFYINNPEETLAVTGHSTIGAVAIYDGRDNQGVFLHTLEEARWVRDALDRWITEGGK